MEPLSATRVEVLLRELAERQHGLVARWQLQELGVPRWLIRRRVERGTLIEVRPGVYAVGHVRTEPRARVLAGVLTCGPGALASHTTAAALRGLHPAFVPIHVTVDRLGVPRQPGLVVHRMQAIERVDRHLDGVIPITSPSLTLIDLAGMLGSAELVAAIERMPALDVRTMRAALHRHAGRRGTKRFRTLLDVYEDHTRSWLERYARGLLRRHGLPRPLVNVRIEGRQRDFAWPEQRLVVEADGNAFHHTRAQRNRDHRRDLDLLVAGWRVQRLTYEQLVLDEAGTATSLRALLAGGPTAPSAAAS